MCVYSALFCLRSKKFRQWQLYCLLCERSGGGGGGCKTRQFVFLISNDDKCECAVACESASNK